MLYAERRGGAPDQEAGRAGGRGRGEPLVLLHGFTQNGRTWGPFADGLARRFQLVTVDAPGHGRSDALHVGLEEGADLMVRAADDVTGADSATWLGYSMGGRYALHVALRHPEAVRRLVLVSATAGIEDPTERDARRRHDETLATMVETEGLESFLDWWLAQPLFASLPAGQTGLKERLEGSPSGLASSLRLAGTGVQAPLWDRLGQLAMPVLVVAGGLDHKYVELGERIAGCIGPNAALKVIQGAGHACHLERPDAVLSAIEEWWPAT